MDPMNETKTVRLWYKDGSYMDVPPSDVAVHACDPELDRVDGIEEILPDDDDEVE